MNIPETQENTMHGTGLAYIRFAIEDISGPGLRSGSISSLSGLCQIHLYILPQTIPRAFIFRIVQGAELSAAVVMPQNIRRRQIILIDQPCQCMYQCIIGFLCKRTVV